jgi:hypothetical protein
MCSRKRLSEAEAKVSGGKGNRFARVAWTARYMPVCLADLATSRSLSTDYILNRWPNQPKKASISAPDIQDRLMQREALAGCIFPCTPYSSIGCIVQAE